MSYAKFEIIRPLYSLQKKISSKNLKVGDRFIFEGHTSLLFKTNAAPINNKFLCCSENGYIEWIDGDVKVTKINGIADTLVRCSIAFKSEYLNKTGFKP